MASGQRGVADRGQLRDQGLANDQIDRRIKAGLLHRVHRGVYLVGHEASPALAAEIAALRACGRGAALGRHTAGFLMGVVPEPPDIHVVLTRRVRPRGGLRIHRTTELLRSDVRYHQGLPITAPVRTVFDLAHDLDDRALANVVNEMQVLRLLTLRDLEIRLPREAGKRGVRAIADIVAAQRQPAETRSKAERLFRGLVQRSGLPEPTTNYRIGRYRADFAWPTLQMVAELDSIQFHSTQPKFVGDRRRWADLDAMGWRVFRFTWWDVTEAPEALLVRLARSLFRDER